MPAPYHNLLSKLDRALMAYLIAKGAGTAADVFPAKRSELKALPCTVLYSEKGTEIANNSGAYSCKTAVMVKTVAVNDIGQVAETARLASETRVAKTFDLFKQNFDAPAADTSGEALATDITAAARALAISDPTHHADLADFTALDVIDKGIEAGFDDNDVWVDTLNLEIPCCPGNVS
jgi:hypothetical protein